MYVRATQRRNKDGSVVRYVALAHNRRDGALTKAEVLLNLGREDRLDMDGLRRLAGSISRYLGDEPPAGDQLAFDDGALPDGLDVVASRPLGAAWLLDGLSRRLGIAHALQTAVGGRRFTTDVERVLSRWSRTGRSRRARSWPPRSGRPRMWRSPGWRGWMTIRRTGR